MDEPQSLRGRAAGGQPRTLVASSSRARRLASTDSERSGCSIARARHSRGTGLQPPDRLLGAADEGARAEFELAASLGLRRSELLTLTWADVDFEAREVVVRASKTEAGERTVPMFGSARRVLLEQKARSRFKRPEDVVFPNAAGHPERPADWARREFLPARKRAKLRDSLRLHDLRHYAVSRLIEQGANVLLVSKVAGHARPSVTLDVYAHLFKEGLAEAAERFDPLARGRREVDGRPALLAASVAASRDAPTARYVR